MRSRYIFSYRTSREGVARAPGAQLKFEEYAPRYDAVVPNPKLADVTEASMAALGIEVQVPERDERMGSSDIGNVSQVVPTLHPYIAIGPPRMGGHIIELHEAAVSPAGQDGTMRAAKVLAMTAVDLLADTAHISAAKEAFRGQGIQRVD